MDVLGRTHTYLMHEDRAEREADSVIDAHIEGALFGALDSETDAATGMQLQAALRTLLGTGAAQEPLRWLSTCSRVALAAGVAVTPGSAFAPASTPPAMAPTPPPLGTEASLISMPAGAQLCL